MAAERLWIKETLKPGLNQMRSQLVCPPSRFRFLNARNLD